MHQGEEITDGDYVGLLVFRYPTSKLVEAYTQLAFAGRALNREPGLRFFKYGGTGRHRGFSAQPDFSRFALFSVWEDRRSWEQFLHKSRFVEALHNSVILLWYVSLAPLMGFGKWDGQEISSGVASRGVRDDEKIAVLTRATIRFRSLFDFWKSVPAVSQQIEEFPGCLYTLGFGELPWIRQATFSLWKSSEELKRFAYGEGGAHSAVVKRTRERGWYSEEMFYRFAVDEGKALIETGNEPFPRW